MGGDRAVSGEISTPPALAEGPVHCEWVVHASAPSHLLMLQFKRFQLDGILSSLPNFSCYSLFYSFCFVSSYLFSLRYFLFLLAYFTATCQVARMRCCVSTRARVRCRIWRPVAPIFTQLTSRKRAQYELRMEFLIVKPLFTSLTDQSNLSSYG